MARTAHMYFVWLVCAGLAATEVAAQQDMGQQFTPAPAGVQLKVAETTVDLSQPSDVSLHLQLVNGSRQTVKVWPGMHSLTAIGSDGAETRCENPPNTGDHSVTVPRILRSGETYSEQVALDADVCNGLRQARALQVQVMFFEAGGLETSVASQSISVQTSTSATEAVRAVLTRQAADWNRGDLGAFATGYKNSPDILFIGRKTSRGYDGMLASYRQGYATREAMGTLTFSRLEVQPLDMQFATATGNYHLERTVAVGGNADGYFLLVFEQTASGWKIVRDDTTSLPAPPRP